jgi:hypothetical protein
VYYFHLAVIEKGVLENMLGPNVNEVMAEWRKLQNEELRGLYLSVNIIWVTKSGAMRW